MAITERAEAVEALLIHRSDESAALQWACPQIPDAILRRISECYPGFDADLHFDSLKQIRDARQTPNPLNWNPGEVLGLIRWEIPASGDAAEHLMRYFACAALVSATGGNSGSGDCSDSTAVRLTESAGELGRDAGWAAFRSLAAHFVVCDENFDESPTISCMAMLAVAFRDNLKDTTLIPFLIDWARDVAKRKRDDSGYRAQEELRCGDAEIAPMLRRAARRFLVSSPNQPAVGKNTPGGQPASAEEIEIQRWVDAEILAFRRTFE